MQTQDIEGFEKSNNTFLEYYEKPTESFKDNRFGKIKILQNKYNRNDKLMIKEIKSRHLYQCEKDLFQVKERYNMNHTNLLEMTSYTYGKVKGKSGKKYYIVSGFYEFNENSLDNLIEQQKQIGQKFDDVLKVIIFLQNNERLHGDIRPKYIFYDNSKNIFKLADRLGDPRQPNQIQLSYLKKNQDIYMSPSIFEVLINRENCLKHNPYKSEVFSLGMVVLECGILKNIQDIYDKDNKQISLDKMIEYLEEFFQDYQEDEVLLEILQSCLELSPKLRKDPRATLKNLYKLKQSAKSHYEVDDINSDMQEEYDSLDREFEKKEQDQESNTENNQEQKQNDIDIGQSNMDYEFSQLNNFNTDRQERKESNEENQNQIYQQNLQQSQNLSTERDKYNDSDQEMFNTQEFEKEDQQQQQDKHNDSEVSLKEQAQQNEDQNQLSIGNQRIENQDEFEQKLRMFNQQQEKNSIENQQQSEISELQQSDHDDQEMLENEDNNQQYEIQVDEINPEDNVYFSSTVNQGYFHQVESEQSSQNEDDNDNSSQKTVENKYDKAQTQYKNNSQENSSRSDKQNIKIIERKQTEELRDQSEDEEQFEIKSENEDNNLQIEQQGQLGKQYSVTINGQEQDDFQAYQQLEKEGPNQDDIKNLQENVYEEPLQPLNFEEIQNKQIMQKKFQAVEKVQLPKMLQDLSYNNMQFSQLSKNNQFDINTDNINFKNFEQIDFSQHVVKSIDIPVYDKLRDSQNSQQNLEQTQKKQNLETLLRKHSKDPKYSQESLQLDNNDKGPTQAQDIRNKYFKISNERNQDGNSTLKSSYNKDSYQNIQNNFDPYDFQNDQITSQLNTKILMSQYEQKLPSLSINEYQNQEPLHYKSYQEYQAHKQQKQSQDSRGHDPEVRIRKAKRSSERSMSKEILGYQPYTQQQYMQNSIDDIPIKLDKNHNEIPIQRIVEKTSVKRTEYLNKNNDIKERVSKTTGRIVNLNQQYQYSIEDKNLAKNISSHNLYQDSKNQDKNFLSKNPVHQQSVSYLQQRVQPNSHRVIKISNKAEPTQNYQQNPQVNFNKNPFYTNEYGTININNIKRITHDPRIESGQKIYKEITTTQHKPVKMIDYTLKNGFRSQRVIPSGQQQYQFSQKVSHIIKDSKEVVNNDGKVVRRIKL